MRIIQVQTQAEAAGAQRISSVVGESLRERKHKVLTCFLYRKTAAYDADPQAAFMLERPPRHIFDYCRIVIRLILRVLREQPDALVLYQHYGNIVGSLVGRVARIPIVIANQNGLPKRGGLRGVASWLDKCLGSAGLYDANIVNSEFSLKAFEGYPSKYRAKIVKIEHGVVALDSALDVAGARLHLGLPVEGFLISSVGRLSPQKNHEVLVHAIRDLPDVHLAIAGQGALSSHLRGLAARLGVSERLYLLGELGDTDIGHLFRASDIFAFPSKDETFGLAVVEAVIAGVPVIANDLPVLREVLTTSRGESAAVFFDADKASSTAAAIMSMRASAEIRAELADRARNLAERYAVDRMVDRYEDCLTARAKACE